MTSLDKNTSIQEPVVIIGIGIPGCGKTTTLKPLAEQENYVYINADDIREELTGDPTNHTREPAVWSIVHDRIAHGLKTRGIILDTTQSKRSDRIQMVKRCRDNGAKHVTAYWFNTPLETCIKRNQARARTVPTHVLQTMHERLQTTPPSIDEGFDKIIQVI